MFKKNRVFMLIVFLESLNASERRCYPHRAVMQRALFVIPEVEEDEGNDVIKLNKEFVHKLEKFRQHMLRTKFRIMEYSRVVDLYDHICEKNIQLAECISLCEKLHPGKGIEKFLNRLYMDIPNSLMVSLSERIKRKEDLFHIFEAIKREKANGDVEAERKMTRLM